jgi:Zn-dependent M28 family amino/carboxypeptidase
LGIGQEDGLRLRRLIRAGAQPTARVAMSNRIVRGEGRNVIAEIPGSERPEEIVLAGGHLDSWDVAQGATDNGLGSAIVLEAARALAALGRRPKRTLRFVLWAAEEIGLLGSHDYVERHADTLDDHVAVMNFDMTGAPYGYWTPGRKNRHPLLADLATQLAPLGMGDDHAHKAGLHSDHQPFMLAGVPVVGLQARLVPEGGRYYHSVGDTFEKVSLPDFCRAACVASHTLWALADTEERPWPRLDRKAVLAMVEEADLVEALGVDGQGPGSWGHGQLEG